MTARGLRMALGSSGAMIWWLRWSTNGERAKSRWVAAARGLLCGLTLFCDFLGTYSSFRCDMWQSSLQSHFFGLISTFCMDLFSSIARGTKATGKEFGPCKKVQISPKIRKSLYGVGIGIKNLSHMGTVQKNVKCDNPHSIHISVTIIIYIYDSFTLSNSSEKPLLQIPFNYVQF